MRLTRAGMRSFGAGSRARSFGIGAVVTMVLLTTACASLPSPGASSNTSPSSTPSSSTPLVCDDLVTPDTVAAVLAAEPSDVTSAVQPSDALDLASLSAAGGLACSWRVGDGQQSIGSGSGDWAYLTIRILPDAADDWVAPSGGDLPSEETRTIAGIDATTTTGETGWRVSAPVGSAWVDLGITASGLTSTGSRFTGTPSGEVLDNLASAAEATFTTVQSASAARLTWPAIPFREGDPACDGSLDASVIVSALGYGDATTNSTLIDPRKEAIRSLADAVNARLGSYTCALFAEGFGSTDILVLRGGTSIIDALAQTPDIAAAVEPVELAGAVDGERALIARRSDGPRSPIFFTVGYTFYVVHSGDGAQAVAEGIIAQTR